jgi:ribosomal protein L20A (L18A)
MQNPFSLSFGKEPTSFIERGKQSREIIDSFLDENPAYQVCMITGVRGSGKTVMLTDIAKHFRENEDWIVVDLSPERDLLHSFAAELSNRTDLLELFRDAKINLSFLGLGLEIDGVPPITDISVAVTKMLERIAKKEKKVLVTIDEVTCNQTMKEFTSLFQIFIRRDFPVFLLMTGLYENIYELQNEKTLTFLYRAPKMELRPLNIGMIAKKYREIFDLSEEDALSMSQETMGYPFAFQVLGFLCWKNKAKWTEMLDEYSQYLEEYVYEKLWSELSAQDKVVLRAMSESESRKVEAIRAKAGKNSSNFSVYRNRLIKKGIIISTEYGYLEFALPRFREFVKHFSVG